MRGADRFADADLAGALFHGDQHDVHDADAADEQRDEGDQQENDRERERNILCGAEDGGEGLHVVFGAGRMTAVKNLSNAALDGIDLIGALGLRVESTQDLGAGVVLHESQRNDDGFVFDFGEPKGRDALAENADDREAKFAQTDRAADGIVETEGAIGDFFCDEAHLAALLHVGRIEVAATHDHEAPNGLIAEGDADEIDWALFAASNNRHRKLTRAGDFGDAGDLGFDGIHVVERNFVVERSGFAAGVDQLDVNHVGADRFDLADDIFLAGERDGDDEHDTSAADDDAERGENRADLVGAECVDSDREGFTQGHHGYDFLRRLMASEAVWLFGSSFSAASYSAMAACGLFWFS